MNEQTTFHSPGALKDMLKGKQDTMVGASMLHVKCLMQETQKSRMLKEQLHRKRSCKKKQGAVQIRGNYNEHLVFMLGADLFSR